MPDPSLAARFLRMKKKMPAMRPIKRIGPAMAAPRTPGEIVSPELAGGGAEDADSDGEEVGFLVSPPRVPVIEGPSSDAVPDS